MVALLSKSLTTPFSNLESFDKNKNMKQRLVLIGNSLVQPLDLLTLVWPRVWVFGQVGGNPVTHHWDSVWPELDETPKPATDPSIFRLIHSPAHPFSRPSIFPPIPIPALPFVWRGSWAKSDQDRKTPPPGTDECAGGGGRVLGINRGGPSNCARNRSAHSIFQSNFAFLNAFFLKIVI